MNYLIAICVFVFLVICIYQIAEGFPVIYKRRERKRTEAWLNRNQIKEENKEKIKALDKELRGEGDVELYVELNKYNLPEDDKWQPLLPKFIKELLAVGWTTEIPIYTKYKYGRYEIYLSTSDQDIINKSIPIIHKYIDLYEEI